MPGSTEYELPASLVPFAVRAATENIPISVIARVLKQPSELVRETLHDALSSGTIATLPREDWPPTGKKTDHVPTESPLHIADDVLLVSSMRVFKMTPLQAAVFLVLLKRNDAHKDVLHNAIEHRRLTRSKKPNDLNPTDPKLVDVEICHLRKKLKPHGLEIQTLHAYGYYMERPHRKKALDVLTTVAHTAPAGLA